MLLLLALLLAPVALSDGAVRGLLWQIRDWPSSHPSQPQSHKRYLPYHPVARFRGISVESQPVLYPFEVVVEPSRKDIEHLEQLERSLRAAELLAMFGVLLEERALSSRARISKGVRFGISRR